ncbi:K(+)/H(+) antiporter [Tulasnella sp. 403]|nr:K(+)/H(+) antiporter [Tulasnella sp. 403]
MRISHTRSRYIYELYYKREAISKELYEWLLKEGYGDANLIAKWKKQGYEKLCCVRCIQTRDMNYQGSTCICRIPKAQLKSGTIVECTHCGKMPEFSDAIYDIGRQLVGRAAAEQGGILSGDNPAAYNPGDPFRLWVIQLVVIIGMTQLLSMFLGRIRQPRVIAEVIGGILLGPTVMGRIPKFSNTIFPAQSLPFLTLVSTIGLVLFLFLVGLEIDTSVVKKNARASALISAAGILLPFGVGAGVAVPLYHNFVHNQDDVSFGYFLLFVGVAISITAFPVLCRILTELRLLDTDVGVVVLSAGVGNDVVGWILLALVVALVNASTGLTALWVLLTCVGFVIFLMLPVRWAFRWLARWDGSLDSGTPSTLMMTVTLLLVFISAFFTDVIGVHAIFGGFLAGLIIPKEGGFSIALVEKLEDLVAICFLPLYFVLSGLKTNLGLLDNGITWGYVILICTVAFFGKFIGCAVTARLCGFGLRESGAIGSLMSCKGLVELIVLNIGLQAGILDTRLFSMFVLHALVLTFITTPLTIWVYPPHLRHHFGAIHDKTSEDRESHRPKRDDIIQGLKTRFTIVLHKMEYMPAIMTLVQYLQPPMMDKSAATSTSEKEQLIKTAESSPRMAIDALRLIELSQRTSDVIRGTVADELIQRDAVLSVFRTFGHLNHIPVASTLSIVPFDEFSTIVSSHSRETASDLTIIPWTFGSSAEDETLASNTGPSAMHNPFESLFGKTHTYDKAAAAVYSHFVRRVFAESGTDVALFVDNGLSTANSIEGLHIFLPFFGGPDDRIALDFVVQLCGHPDVTATIVKVTKTEIQPVISSDSIDAVKAEAVASAVATNANLTAISGTGFPDTVYPSATTQTRATSDMADNIAWNKYTTEAGAEVTPRSALVTNALTRITFGEIESALPLRAILDRGVEEQGAAKEGGKSLLVVTGRARRLAVESHAQELRGMLAEQHAQYVGGEVRKSLGESYNPTVSIEHITRGNTLFSLMSQPNPINPLPTLQGLYFSPSSYPHEQKKMAATTSSADPRNALHMPMPAYPPYFFPFPSFFPGPQGWGYMGPPSDYQIPFDPYKLPPPSTSMELVLRDKSNEALSPEDTSRALVKYTPVQRDTPATYPRPPEDDPENPPMALHPYLYQESCPVVWDVRTNLRHCARRKDGERLSTIALKANAFGETVKTIRILCAEGDFAWSVHVHREKGISVGDVFMEIGSALDGEVTDPERFIAAPERVEKAEAARAANEGTGAVKIRGAGDVLRRVDFLGSKTRFLGLVHSSAKEHEMVVRRKVHAHDKPNTWIMVLGERE